MTIETDVSPAAAAIQPRFAVFLTGHSSNFTQEKYGGYGQLCVDLLQDSGEAWDIIPIVDGALPSSQELDQYDAFVITGSKYDAHGNDPWILDLCDILRELHSKCKKVLGICFGHQILCRALGGKTGRAPVGWELGARAVQLSLDAFSLKPYARDLPDVLRIIESHQDQAFEIPPGAEILGYSTRTPIEIFALGNHILGIQGHPEFEEDIVLDIIENKMALGVISEDIANHAKASIMENKPDKSSCQKLCKNFLKSDSIFTL